MSWNQDKAGCAPRPELMAEREPISTQKWGSGGSAQCLLWDFSPCPHLLCHRGKVRIKEPFVKHPCQTLRNCAGFPDTFRKRPEIVLSGVLERHEEEYFNTETFSYSFRGIPVTIPVEPTLVKPHSLAEKENEKEDDWRQVKHGQSRAFSGSF